jgi:hypothetical protein
MAVRNTASRMGATSAASMRAAPKQSLELPAVCTAGFVSSASRLTISRMMHRNSAARPSRPKPRRDRVHARRPPAAASGACGGAARS